MAKSAENSPVYSILPLIKSYQNSKAFVILFGFRKEKQNKKVAPSLELNQVFGWNYSILVTEKALHSCFVDGDGVRVVS